jgi:adenosylmethionine-8-amino-7-oxononanoate aminotransferase
MYLSMPVGSLDHLWLHFTEMGRYRDGEELQIIVRGDGCYVEDAAGRRYLDALAGLFCVNIGYGFGEEMGEAAARPDARAALRHQLDVRPPALDRARG